MSHESSAGGHDPVGCPNKPQFRQEMEGDESGSESLPPVRAAEGHVKRSTVAQDQFPMLGGGN